MSTASMASNRTTTTMSMSSVSREDSHISMKNKSIKHAGNDTIMEETSEELRAEGPSSDPDEIKLADNQSSVD